MEQISSNTQKGLKAFEFALALGLFLVFVVFVAWYFLQRPAPQTNTQPGNGSSAADERARIIAELNAATKNTPPLTPEERARIISEMNAASKKLPPLSAEERAKIINELSKQSK